MRDIRDAFKRDVVDAASVNETITTRMTQFFLIIMLGWTAFNLIVCSIFHVEITIICYFSFQLIMFFLFVSIGYLFRIERYLCKLLDLGVILVTPICWYICGGTTSSSVNSMYIMAIVYFCLCSKGANRVMGVLLAIMEVGGVTVITKRFPQLAMPPYAPGESILTCNSCIGFSTTIVIVGMLFKQIREYRLENERSEEYREELLKSNALQKKFLANMSHEIRSPLGIVLGFNDLIAKSDDIEEIKEYSRTISSSGETLRVVINDILDYSKIESGKFEIIEGDYSLKALLKEVGKNIKLMASEKGLKFESRIDENVPDMLIGDDVRIRQCLINVLSNAVKYTRMGSVSLIVTCTMDEADKDICNLSFLCRDTGKGISKEAIPHLFSAFERIDESHMRGIEGTGLGLAITKALIDEMNGTISVESVVGEGSDFYIKLPQKLSDKEPESFTKMEDLSLAGIRLALVDDTRPNLILCKKLLELRGATVDTFDSGKMFVEACKSQAYDLLLIDHMMPGMNGIEVLNALKDYDGPNKNTPRFIFTANAMAGAEKEYMDYGFTGFISKPINKDEFANKLIEALR